jgi:hypothetical protein
MAWFRYVLYFLGVALLTWMLTQIEISFPGSLKLYEFVGPGAGHGTSEYSPVEIIQLLILGVCGALMGWVAMNCPSQRPLAIGFGGLALVFLIRELDFFLDRYLIENLWPVLIAVAAAFLIVYTHRHRRRLTIALARIWPSPGLALLFAGAAILFAFVHLVGNELLWQSILGDAYEPTVTTAVEEFVELIGYMLWLIGTIEYVYQAKAIAMREPRPAAQRLRQRRRERGDGTY